MGEQHRGQLRMRDRARTDGAEILQDATLIMMSSVHMTHKNLNFLNKNVRSLSNA